MRASDPAPGYLQGMNELLILAPVAVLLSVYLIHRFRAPAEQLGLVDVPGGRKSHAGNVPLVGGIGIFIAFAFVSLLIQGGLQPYRALFAGMGLLLITGVLDDLHDLGAVEKMVLHVFVGLVLILWGGLSIVHLGELPLLGHVVLDWAALPFTLICVVGLINAVNMLDGADGLAGGVMLSVLFWLAVIGASAAEYESMMLPSLLACSLLGFLFFNFPWRGRAASVFLGDSGSTMLGFAAAWFAIELAFKQGTGIPPVAIAWILALPVFDAMSLILRRIVKGQSPMTADREHLHHIFERAGFSCSTTAWFCTGLAFAMGGIGVGSWWLGVPQAWMWPPLLLLLALHFLFVQRAWRITRMLRRLRMREVV